MEPTSHTNRVRVENLDELCSHGHRELRTDALGIATVGLTACDGSRASTATSAACACKSPLRTRCWTSTESCSSRGTDTAMLADSVNFVASSTFTINSAWCCFERCRGYQIRVG